MRYWTMIVIGAALLPMPPATAQVINGQSTYESNLQNRPPVDLEDSALMPKPQPRSEADEAERQTEKSKSLYPSR